VGGRLLTGRSPYILIVGGPPDRLTKVKREGAGGVCGGNWVLHLRGPPPFSQRNPLQEKGWVSLGGRKKKQRSPFCKLGHWERGSNSGRGGARGGGPSEKRPQRKSEGVPAGLRKRQREGRYGVKKSGGGKSSRRESGERSTPRAWGKCSLGEQKKRRRET